MKRVMTLVLGLLILPLGGCFGSDDDNADRDGGRYGGRGRGNDRFDERYDDRARSGQRNTGYYRESDMVRIGTVVANNNREQNDLLEIKGKERFKGLLFQVDRGEVAVDHIRVTFDDDTFVEPPTATRFRAGEQTRLIDLPGNNRDVKRVRIKYRSISGGDSTISVYGVPTSYRER